MKRILTLGLLLGLLVPGVGYPQPDRSDEVQKLMAGLESASRVQRLNSAKNHLPLRIARRGAVSEDR